MKLHYKGKYDLNPESLPHGEHKPGAVRFKEAEDTKELGGDSKCSLPCDHNRAGGFGIYPMQALYHGEHLADTCRCSGVNGGPFSA